MPNGLIDDASLRAHPDGLALSLTLPWYRSLWLSSVARCASRVDGEAVDAADLAFELDGVRYALDELPEQSDVLWYLQAAPAAHRRAGRSPSRSARRTRSRSSASCACRTCRSRRAPTAGPACTCRTSCGSR